MWCIVKKGNVYQDHTKQEQKRSADSGRLNTLNIRKNKTDLTILAWQNEPIINLWMRGFGSF